jgi:hypothetical protein
MIVEERNSRPITVEAFRFIQLKNPEAYTGVASDTNFVHHPSLGDSQILTVDGTNVKKILFKPYTSLNNLKSINKKLYPFMFWLKKNRGKITSENLAKATSGIENLSLMQRLEVWDNLFYQTQINSSQALVEGLIRILQADHFLTHYRDAVASLKEKETLIIQPLKEVARASVVIPNELFKQDQGQGNSTRTISAIDDRSKKILSNKLDIDILNTSIDCNKKAIQEIKKAEVFYASNNREAYESAYQNYQDKLNELTDKAQEITNEAGTIKICGQEIEPFTFAPQNTWDDAYLEATISVKNLAIYKSFKAKQHITVADTRAAIEQSLVDLENQVFRKIKKNKSKVLIHKGILIPLRNRPLNNSYVFKATPIRFKENTYSIYVTQYFENQDTKARKIEATVNTSEKITTTHSTLKPIAETDNYVTFELFPEGIVMSSRDVTFNVKGFFETDNSDYNSTFKYDAVKPDSITSVASTVGQSNSDSIPLPNIFGVMGVKIAEFKKVNQTLCCYTEGEVSHIENILAREYKERATRNLIRTELTTEKTTEKELEQLSDTTSTDRHEIQSEISLILQKDKATSLAVSASVGGTYNFPNGGINFNTTGSFNTSSSSSSSSNFSESESYAKELTQRAMKRLVEKTTYKRTSKMIREFEENNKHGFDNREGTEHVTGVYRWVDKIYKNDLVNYGKRLMYEFMLPEPAKNYKHLLIKNLEASKTQSCETVLLDEPIKPIDFGILNHNYVNKHNYVNLANYYGVEVEDYPIDNIRIAKSFAEDFYQTGSQKGDFAKWHVAQNFEFKIPEGYKCISFESRFAIRRHGDTESIYGDLLIGNRSYYFNSEGSREFHSSTAFNTPQPQFKPVEEYLPIALSAEDIGVFAMNISAYCILKQEVISNWKAIFLTAISKSYDEMLQQYNDSLYEQCLNKKQDELSNDASETPNYNINPLMARSIEKREIKRLIIELILQRNYFGIQIIGFNNYIEDPCNDTLNINTSNSMYLQHMRYAKFLEGAFEWDIMAYSFLPYYWADENEWGDLLSIDAAADHIFLAFLQSGMSNIVLPVRPGLEKSVAFFLETGRLWNGDGFVLDGQDDLYPAIDQNLQIEIDADGNEIEYDDKGNPIPRVESTWETRVPSTLTIVQDYNNPLAAEGLPCFCKNDGENNIGYAPDGNYNTLSGKSD